MAVPDLRLHEVTFCSRVAGWANALFARHPEWPFRRAEIEESKAIKRKRSDLRFYGDADRLILAGEVKMPGTRPGFTPYNAELVEDSATKADNAGAEFFFTWNVNDFVLFDRKKWQLPPMERRVNAYPLGLALDKPEDVDRAEVEARIQQFLAEFFGELAAILAGQQPEWGMRLDEWFIRAFESHISWPVKLTAEFLWSKTDSDKTFDHQFQDWLGREQGWLFARNDPKQWRDILDRAARTLGYVFANRWIIDPEERHKFGQHYTSEDLFDEVFPVANEPAKFAASKNGRLIQQNKAFANNGGNPVQRKQKHGGPCCRHLSSQWHQRMAAAFAADGQARLRFSETAGSRFCGRLFLAWVPEASADAQEQSCLLGTEDCAKHGARPTDNSPTQENRRYAQAFERDKKLGTQLTTR